MKKTLFIFCGITLCLQMAGASAMAAPIWTNGSYTIETGAATDFAPDARNVLSGLLPSFVSNNKAAQEQTGPVSNLTDGVILNETAPKNQPFPGRYTIGSNAVFVYDLTNSYPRGVKVLGFRLYSRWGDNSRDQINLTSIEVQTCSATNWVALVNSAVNYQPATDGFGVVYLSESDGVTPLCRMVSAIRVTFGSLENNYCGYAEMELVGTDERASDAQEPVLFPTISDITWTSAKLSCAVVACGNETEACSLQGAWGQTLPELQALKAAMTENEAWTTNLTSLIPGTDYTYAFRADNGREGGVTNVTGTFTTVDSSAPTFIPSLSAAKYDSALFFWQLTNCGDGSDFASVTLEVSADPDFTTRMSYPVRAIDDESALPQSGTCTATGLTLGTSYFARFRVVNRWQDVTLSAVVPFNTLTAPCVFQGLNATVNGARVMVSDSLLEVPSGAVLEVGLYLDSLELRHWSGVTAPQTFSAEGMLTRDTGVVKLMVTATYQGQGFPYIETQPISSTGGVETLAAASNLMNRVIFCGESIALPAPAGLGHYEMLGDAIAVLEGNTIRTRTHGFTMLRLIDALGATNDFRFAVAPRPIGSGDVFYRTVSNQNSPWNSDTAWVNLSGRTTRLYPNAPDDIAVFLGTSGWWMLNIPPEGITVGGIVAGALYSGTILPRRSNDSQYDATLTFSRTDGENAFFDFSQPFPFYLDNNKLGPLTFRLGNQNDGQNVCLLTMTFTTPALEFRTVADSAAAELKRTTAIYLACGVSAFNVPDGKTLRFISPGETLTDQFTFSFYGPRSGFFGSGTIENRGFSFSVTSPRFHTMDFSGTYRELSLLHGSSNLSSLGSNVVMEIIGGWKTNGDSRTSASVGFDPGNNTANPGINMLDARGILLSGARFNIPTIGGTWTNSIVSTNIIKGLVVEGEASLHYQGSYGENRVRSPLTVSELERKDDRTTMSIHGFNLRDGRRDEWRGPCTISNINDFVIGEPGDPVTGNVYPIIPWMTVTANNNGYGYEYWGNESLFAAATNNTLVSYKRSQTLGSAGEHDNVYFDGKGISISTNKTINSLAYNTAETPPCPNNLRMGEGRVLTLTSGGMLFDCSTRYFGHPAEIEKSGTVVFGGECAYLISGFGWPENTGKDFNCMWAEIVATNDLVKGGAGHLVIAGDQRGIDGTVYVNAGALWIGYPGHLQCGWLYLTRPDLMWGAATDCDYFVRGGAVLGICTNGYYADGKLQSTIVPDSVIKLKDNYDAAAVIDLEADMNCRYLYIGDETAPRGVYGSSESGAPFADDIHFSGPGKLTVARDLCRSPAVIILR